MERNKHMNVFEEYTHPRGPKMPLENNLTRALAICLEENADFMTVFMKKISKVLKKPSLDKQYINPSSLEKKSRIVNSDMKRYKVGIQLDLVKINDFGTINRIYGLTLATEKYEFKDIETKDEKKREITDIYIQFDKTLIIIEAKRNATDATVQLQKQIKDACNKCDSEIKKPVLKGITWEDVFEVIDDYYKDKPDTQDRIISDYSELLYKYLPGCSPTRKLGELKQLEVSQSFIENFDVLVNARLISLKKEYLKKYNPLKEVQYDRKAIPLELDYLAECDMKYDSDLNTINTVMYIGSKKDQFIKFKKTSKSETLLKAKPMSFDSKEYTVEVTPYLRFYDNFGRQIEMYELADKDKKLDGYQSIIGQFKKDDDGNWFRHGTNLMVELKRILRNNLANHKGFKYGFKIDFDEKIKNRKCLISTIQFCIQVKVPFDEACEYDKENKMPDLIHEAIKMVSPD